LSGAGCGASRFSRAWPFPVIFPAASGDKNFSFMIYNRQRRVRLLPKQLDHFAFEVASTLKLGRRWFDVSLVDDAEIQRLNGEFRGQSKPTDVLSFPWAAANRKFEGRVEAFEELNGFVGDVVISTQTAARDAAEEGMSLDVKLRQLILHGVLHLLGYDHESDKGKMHRLERKLRKQFGINKLERTSAEAEPKCPPPGKGQRRTAARPGKGDTA
jgi:probable rRNA maturation factor